MPGGYSLGSYEHYDRDSCACGCGNKARPGLQPRFFASGCRERWIAKLALDEAEPAVEPHDDGQVTAVIAFDQAVTTEQVEEVRAALEAGTGRLATAAAAVTLRRRPLWRRLLNAIKD